MNARIHADPTCIVVATDPSLTARDEVPVAVGLGTRLGVPVHVLRPGERFGRREDGDRPLLVCAVHRRGRPMSSTARSTAGGTMRSWVAVGPALQPVPRRLPEELVLALDGTPATESALPGARDWAATHGLRVTLVVIIPDVPMPLRPRPDDHRHRLQLDPDGYVEPFIEQLSRAAIDTKVERIREPLHVADAVGSHLRNRHHTVLVAPAERAPGRRRGALSGTSAASFIRSAPVPVLVVPTRAAS